jgi:hypothetical protein
VQRVKGIYEASFPAWFLSEQTFLSAFAGYEIVARFDCREMQRMGALVARGRGYIMRRRESAKQESEG